MITLRLKYIKEHNMKFLSHLELIKTVERAFRRMDIPMSFSQGYSPKPKISYAAPLPVGVESDCEFLDVELDEKIDIVEFLKNQLAYMPLGLSFVEGQYFGKEKSLMSIVSDSSYIITLKTEEAHSREFVQEKVTAFLAEESITYERMNKRDNLKVIDIKPLIIELELIEVLETVITLKALLKTGSSGNLKPEKMSEMFAEHASIKLVKSMDRYRRIELYTRNKQQQLLSLFEV